MNILFLTLSRISNIEERGIYTDLMREFVRHGHKIHIVSPSERRFKQSTQVIDKGTYKVLRVKTLNIQKTNVIEKGIGTLLLEYQYQQAIQKYWKDIRFDLILYSTPPITFNKVIASLKKKYQAKTYLLLKDIFPQNAVDLGMFKKGSFIYKIFRKEEEKLYELSDHIGCMSPANAAYVLKHNPSVDTSKIEICPNSIELVENGKSINNREELLKKLNIPTDKVLFIYGGNLGKPQGVDFLTGIIAAHEMKENSFIIVVGSGTEYGKIKAWFDTNHPHNACLLASLPKDEYDQLVRTCDVGLIFLDKRFTIPNFPSRLLSYLENKMPVLLATDVNTDMGQIAQENGFGLWTESGNLDEFMKLVAYMKEDPERTKMMGIKGYDFLKSNYTVEDGYRIIMSHLN